MKLHIRRIEKPQDFMALAPIWAQVTKETGHRSLFDSYDWFWCCWHGVWPQHRPEVLIVEDSGGPIGIVPLMHWSGRLLGLPVRYIGFLGCPSTPWADILTVEGHDLVLEAVLDHLARRSDWNIAWLQKLPATSPTLKALESMPPSRLLWRCAGHIRYPYLTIKGGWEHFIKTKNPLARDMNRKVQAQLQRSGDFDFEEHRTVDPQGSLIRELIAIMSSCSQLNRASRGATMCRPLAFFRELTRRASKNGWLSLWSLRLDGQLIAFEYQLRCHGKAHVLWTGDVPDHRELQPQKILQMVTLRTLFEPPTIYEYSMGPGLQDDQPWWATAHHEAVHIEIYRPGFYARMLKRLEAANALGVTTWS
jgi:CelD/BcsL family acetyltransferase involved in cellulose biosynthesis